MEFYLLFIPSRFFFLFFFYNVPYNFYAEEISNIQDFGHPTAYKSVHPRDRKQTFCLTLMSLTCT